MSLEELIKSRIRAHGNITVADYMEIVLSHPEHGYYMKRDPLGVAGDFITAPEISQVFGEIIGAWLVHNWQLSGSPKEVALVELGAGRGTLMADILRTTKNIKGFHEAVSVHLVEISPILKQKQWKSLAGKHSRIEWHKTIDTLPQIPILLVANEFFDALPIRQFVSHSDGWHERMVGLAGGELVFVNTLASVMLPISVMSIQSILEDLGGVLGNQSQDVSANATKEKVIETCEPSIMIIRQISEHIATHGGAALIIDYGYNEGSFGDTLQAVKNHKHHPVLKDIGDADITAHVDFLALSQAAQMEGVNVHEIIPQGAFLMRMGAGDRTTSLCKISTPEQQKSLISGLKRLADPAEMGELFKVLAITWEKITQTEGF
jgi:NADH dehydrogenase [ubiquinone] 1 alpha subcomplex assembly factor 7